MSDVTLTSGKTSITLHGNDWDGHGLALASLQGWYETPSAKVASTARGQGDGGHDIPEADILYEARTVTIGYRVVAGSDRSAALEQLRLLDRLCHGLVTCRVMDEGQDTVCEGGYYARALDQKTQNPLWQDVTGSLTLVFQRPERMSATPRSTQLAALSGASTASGGGLDYNGVKGLRYPLQYGLDPDTGGRNVTVLENNGSSRAYPVFTVHGPMPDGVELSFPGTASSLTCTQPVQGVPLVLDSRSRTATMGGLDVSRTLTSRGFPTVNPGESVNVALVSRGDGFVDCAIRDTYM